MKGVVASGHPLTAKAASDIFKSGGNAFDAAVAAGFASVVSEPALTSLGGGGFMLVHDEVRKKDTLFDFFVNTPGLNANSNIRPEMNPVDIQFPQCSQTFHTGFASAAVPGMLKGLLHIHKRLCTLPLKTILSPAISYLDQGVEVCPVQEIILGYLEPIFTSTEYGKQVFTVNDHYVKLNDKVFNPLLKSFYQDLSEGSGDIYSGETAKKFISEINRHNGTITADDLETYEVIEREPLKIKYRNREILTNPPPSSGGIILALALHLMENIDLDKLSRDSSDFYVALIELMKEMNYFRPMENRDTISYPFTKSTLNPLIASYLKNVSEKTFISTQGTTHISVMDERGNAASMTTSNGSGSGCFIPGTGIMINNMMGEDDLHPGGFFSSPSGKRVSSMMIPTMVMENGRIQYALGSGGSKRIRTAVLQVLINLIDYNQPLKDAIERSRVHIEDGVVQAEPGIPSEVHERLGRHYKLSGWDQKNMYFGGVHCSSHQMEGWGDSRRGGSVISI